MRSIHFHDRSPLMAAMVSCCLFAFRAQAQDRPSESDMFGPPAQAPPSSGAAEAGAPVAAGAATTPAANPAAPITPQPSAAPDSRDEAILGQTESKMFNDELGPADPLTIGGQLYLRAQSTTLQGQNLKDARTDMPTLLDVFFDARPNDRVRGFVLGRMTYDPLLPSSTGALGNLGPQSAIGGTAGSASLSSLLSGQTNAPHVLLDQLWLRFDIAHAVFITAGRQHVRWGTARFWTPADFLHLRHRNPLDVFDARTGTTMVKVHVPVESKAWNFYAYGITEGENGLPTLSSLAGAARGEFVLDSTELGLGVYGKPNTRAKFAGDLSSGIGDVDLYGEIAVLDARQSDRVRYDPNATLPSAGTPPSYESPSDAQRDLIEQAVDAIYPSYRQRGYRPQAVVGANYSRKYNDNDVWTIGAEYFYNGLGYSDDQVYPGLVFPHANTLVNPASFFYLGKHYAALYFTMPAPYKLDLHTFTLSTLGNLSDRSFITRLDYSYTLLTHLTFEAFGAVHYGRPSGEFRFRLQTPESLGISVTQPPSLFDVGIGLRMAI
ncbi:MAG TPA: hypothetical protein VGI70_14680 [Polyangiales bacterium]